MANDISVDHVEKLVDAETISEMLHISKRGFWRLKSQAKVGPKPLKVGGALRWRLSEILRWIEWNCCDQKEFISRMETQND
jgi:predicted DNA-binding transcriptional regulator AlpA